MRLLVAVITAIFALVAVGYVAFAVDASAKALALTASEFGRVYSLSPGMTYTLIADRYGFQQISQSPGGSSTYATLVLSLPSGYVVFLQPLQQGTMLCNYVANPSTPLLQQCAVYVNSTEVHLPIYYAKPGTYLLQPGTWKITVARDPHQVWMPPLGLIPVVLIVLLIAAFIWRMYR